MKNIKSDLAKRMDDAMGKTRKEVLDKLRWRVAVDEVWEELVDIKIEILWKVRKILKLDIELKGSSLLKTYLKSKYEQH